MGGGRHPNNWERQREQLSAYIDGELSAAERAELERHIPGCPECQEALGELRRVHDLLAALPTPKAPRSFALPLDTRLPTQPATVQTAPRRSRAGPIQWAGAIAATVGLFLLLASVVAGLPGFNSPQYTSASGQNRDTTLYGTQPQTPAAATPSRRTPDLNSTQQPQVGDKSTPGAVTTPADAATPKSTATSVSPQAVSGGPGIPILPITGGGLLVLGAGVYFLGRSQRRREEHAA
jgi:predicted anti-sigma-YlaC factor YlaD